MKMRLDGVSFCDLVLICFWRQLAFDVRWARTGAISCFKSWASSLKVLMINFVEPMDNLANFLNAPRCRSVAHIAQGVFMFPKYDSSAFG